MTSEHDHTCPPYSILSQIMDGYICAFRGLVASLSAFILLGVTVTPDGPFKRPHPAIWRLTFIISIVYELGLIFVLYQVSVCQVFLWLGCCYAVTCLLFPSFTSLAVLSSFICYQFTSCTYTIDLYFFNLCCMFCLYFSNVSPLTCTINMQFSSLYSSYTVSAESVWSF